MKKITVKPNQTVFDIVAGQYGTCEALPEFLANNPGLENEGVEKGVEKGVEMGVEMGGGASRVPWGIAGRERPQAGRAFRLDLPVKAGSTVWIDTDSKRIRNSVVREIENDVTTFDL